MHPVNFGRYDNMSLTKLQLESLEVFRAIQNEKIWMFGSDNDEDACMHAANVDNLRAELRYIRELIKEREGKGNETVD